MSNTFSLYERCAEDVALLQLMGKMPDPPSRNAQMQTSEEAVGHSMPIHAEKALTSTLAALSSIKDDPNNVTAVCIQEEGVVTKVMIAANADSSCHSENLKAVKKGFDGIFQLLRKAATTHREETEHNVFMAIIEMCRERILARARLGDDQSKPPFQKFLEEASHALRQLNAVQNRVPVRKAIRRLGGLLNEYANKSVTVGKDKSRLDPLLANIVEACCQVSKISNLRKVLMDDLKRAEPKTDLKEAEALINMVAKMSQYKSSAARLVKIARRYSAARRMLTFPVRPRDAAFEKGRRNAPASARSVLFRVAMSKGDFISFETLCEKLGVSEDEADARFRQTLDGTLKNAKVHAEIQLIWYLDSHRRSTPPRVLASNKDACHLCNSYMSFQSVHMIPRSHGKVYSGWRFPAIGMSEMHQEYALELEKMIVKRAGRLLSEASKVDDLESMLSSSMGSITTVDTVDESDEYEEQEELGLSDSEQTVVPQDDISLIDSASSDNMSDIAMPPTPGPIGAPPSVLGFAESEEAYPGVDHIFDSHDNIRAPPRDENIFDSPKNTGSRTSPSGRNVFDFHKNLRSPVFDPYRNIRSGVPTSERHAFDVPKNVEASPRDKDVIRYAYVRARARDKKLNSSRRKARAAADEQTLVDPSEYAKAAARAEDVFYPTDDVRAPEHDRKVAGSRRKAQTPAKDQTTITRPDYAEVPAKEERVFYPSDDIETPTSDRKPNGYRKRVPTPIPRKAVIDPPNYVEAPATEDIDTPARGRKANGYRTRLPTPEPRRTVIDRPGYVEAPANEEAVFYPPEGVRTPTYDVQVPDHRKPARAPTSDGVAIDPHEYARTLAHGRATTDASGYSRALPNDRAAIDSPEYTRVLYPQESVEAPVNDKVVNNTPGYTRVLYPQASVDEALEDDEDVVQSPENAEAGAPIKGPNVFDYLKGIERLDPVQKAPQPPKNPAKDVNVFDFADGTESVEAPAKPNPAQGVDVFDFMRAGTDSGTADNADAGGKTKPKAAEDDADDDNASWQSVEQGRTVALRLSDKLKVYIEYSASASASAPAPSRKLRFKVHQIDPTEATRMAERNEVIYDVRRDLLTVNEVACQTDCRFVNIRSAKNVFRIEMKRKGGAGVQV